MAKTLCFHCRSMGLIPGRATMIPHDTKGDQKNETKTPWCCQINKININNNNNKKNFMKMEMQPTPVFLPGKSHGQRSLAGYIT